LKYFVGAVAFGFAAVWIMATLAGALVCLAAAIAAYGAVAVAEWARTKRAARVTGPGIAAPSTFASSSRKPDVEDVPLTADALNSDLGYVYEPTTAMATLTREYGWAYDNGTAWRGIAH
jgi:hypothetical protein